MSGAEIPLALYVHLPWCVRKCPYCDFNSHAIPPRKVNSDFAGPPGIPDELPESAYVDALLRDLDFELERSEPRELRSIFFGGGTPSLFSGAAIGRILEGGARRLRFARNIEITLEANPGSAEAARFRDYRAAGVNRLSIGVQSFDDAHLKSLGRIHGSDEAIRAVRFARAAGFDNFNLDLMFALPRQTQSQALADLEQALALSPAHLSWYHLTLEPNTEFAARPPLLPDADTAAEIHDAGIDKLVGAGFEHYETSAFSRPGRAARHNLNYWQFGDYLGIGAGAHAKRSFVANGALQIERRARHKHPRRYMETAGTAAALQEVRQLSASELPFEFGMNALRLHAGFPAGMFEARTGLPISALDAPLAEARGRDLIETEGNTVRPSRLGRRHLNSLLEFFL